ncbi:MAG: CPBP family glutamic-type intramembrane protease [Chloroflexota bacterium]|nr:CPBP family glutamic-type intramembrane protease [Chloroflexota bacterium]
MASSLNILVREDWEIVEKQAELETSHNLVLLLSVAIFSALATAIVDRFVLSSEAIRSFLVEAASLCLYGAVAMWYALRRRPERWRVAGLTYGFLLAVMALVDYLCKWNLRATFVTSGQMTSPILYTGMLMGLYPLPFLWLRRHYPAEARGIGLHLARPGPWIAAGLLSAALLSGHFLFTSLMSRAVVFHFQPIPYLVWTIFFEFAVQSLSEEMFFRGLVFDYLINTRRQDLWQAALISSGFNLLIYVVKGGWVENPIVTLGVIFYALMMSMLHAILYRASGSIVPGWVSNATFGLFTVFR